MELELERSRATFAVELNDEYGDGITGPDADCIGGTAAVRFDAGKTDANSIDPDGLVNPDPNRVGGLRLRVHDRFSGRVGRCTGAEG